MRAGHRSWLIVFALSAVVSSVCFWLEVNWLTVANQWLGLGVNFDTRPKWFSMLMGLVSWLPWILLALCALPALRRSVWHLVALTAGTLVPYVYVFTVLVVLPPLDEYVHLRAFDSQVWLARNAQTPEWPDRLCMVDDLIASGKLRGRSKSEVLQLLGPPDNLSEWPSWDLVYWLGPERSLFGVDSEWLVIRFGSDDKTSEYQIVRD